MTKSHKFHKKHIEYNIDVQSDVISTTDPDKNMLLSEIQMHKPRLLSRSLSNIDNKDNDSSDIISSDVISTIDSEQNRFVGNVENLDDISNISSLSSDVFSDDIYNPYRIVIEYPSNFYIYTPYQNDQYIPYYYPSCQSDIINKIKLNEIEEIQLQEIIKTHNQLQTYFINVCLEYKNKLDANIPYVHAKYINRESFPYDSSINFYNYLCKVKAHIKMYINMLNNIRANLFTIHSILYS